MQYTTPPPHHGGGVVFEGGQNGFKNCFKNEAFSKGPKNFFKTLKNVLFEVEGPILTSKWSVFSRFGPSKKLNNRGFWAHFGPPRFWMDFSLKIVVFSTFFEDFRLSRKMTPQPVKRVFCCIFCVPCKQLHVMQNPLQKTTKNDQTSSKINVFCEPVLGSLLRGGPESSFFASWLSKNCLRSFFFASCWILSNFWGPNMASTSTLKWL